jgi:hypothetical protein
MFPVIEYMFKALRGTKECLKWTEDKIKDLAQKSKLTIGTNFNRTTKGYILERCRTQNLKPIINFFCIYHKGRQYISYMVPNTDNKYEYGPGWGDTPWDKYDMHTPMVIVYRNRANLKRPEKLSGEWYHYSCELEGDYVTVPQYLTYEPRLRANNDFKISQILSDTYGIPIKELRVLHYNTDRAMRFDILLCRTKVTINLPRDRSYYSATLDFVE